MKISNIYPNILKGLYNFFSVDGTAKFDCVFWFGDLNFRIDQGRHTVEDLVKAIVEQEHPNFEDLLRGDELNDCILKGMMHVYTETKNLATHYIIRIFITEVQVEITQTE